MNINFHIYLVMINELNICNYFPKKQWVHNILAAWNNWSAFQQMIPDSDHSKQWKIYMQYFSSQYLRVFSNFVYIYPYWREIELLAQKSLYSKWLEATKIILMNYYFMFTVLLYFSLTIHHWPLLDVRLTCGIWSIWSS